jgi:hypothetical protein
MLLDRRHRTVLYRKEMTKADSEALCLMSHFSLSYRILSIVHENRYGRYAHAYCVSVKYFLTVLLCGYADRRNVLLLASLRSAARCAFIGVTQEES